MGADIFGDLSREGSVDEGGEHKGAGVVRSHRLGGHAEPGVVREADIVIVEVEDGVALVPISESVSTQESDSECR